MSRNIRPENTPMCDLWTSIGRLCIALNLMNILLQPYSVRLDRFSGRLMVRASDIRRLDDHNYTCLVGADKSRTDVTDAAMHEGCRRG